MKTPQKSRTNPLHIRKPLSFLGLWNALRNQRFIKNTTLNQEKEISRYNSFQERLPLLRFMACSLFGFAPYCDYGA
ncbi:cagY like domain protein [Helicobacter pylori]|uniref:cagY like domain protein n=1 Tax=Helicobacter pylori TaxID=210 RepID=UPI00165B3912|nr:cagY like domain protein [Helicobacter pylori]